MKTMIRFIVAALLILGMNSPVFALEPIAPMIKVSDKPSGIFEELTQEQWNQLLETMLAEESIPSKEEVGAPAPPGSYYMGVGSIQDMDYVNLVSMEPPEKIMSFYMDMLGEMPGWQWSEEFNIFFKADGEMNIERLMSFSIPVIEVKEVSTDDPFAELMFAHVDAEVRPGLKTLVQITYFSR